MRNKYPGVCYYCKSGVAKGAGHFERQRGRWATIHAECVFKQRAEKLADVVKADEAEAHRIATEGVKDNG